MSSELEEVRIMMARLEAKFDMAMLIIADMKKNNEDMEERLSTIETKMNYAAGIAGILAIVAVSMWNWLWTKGTGGAA